MLMAATILGALHERNRTGQGRRLQVAMQDAMIHYMRTCFANMARTGQPARRNGAKSGGGNNAPSGLYPAKGGGPNDYVYLTTSRANPEHWSRLMKLIGREELIEDPRFATGDVRVKNEKELDAIIGEWTRQHDKREAMEKLIAVGVPSGAVFDTMELQNEPSFEERGIMQTVHHHNGDYKMATWPVRIDGKTVRLKGSPALGADSAEVCTTGSASARARSKHCVRKASSNKASLQRLPPAGWEPSFWQRIDAPAASREPRLSSLPLMRSCQRRQGARSGVLAAAGGDPRSPAIGLSFPRQPMQPASTIVSPPDPRRMIARVRLTAEADADRQFACTGDSVFICRQAPTIRLAGAGKRRNVADDIAYPAHWVVLSAAAQIAGKG